MSAIGKLLDRFGGRATRPLSIIGASGQLGYGVPADSVQVYPYAPAMALKITMDRRVVAGSPGDGDVYGAQQHGPLLGVEL